MASLDVARAFPSVSHPSLLAAMSSFGVPPAFVQYVRHVYERGHTILQGQGWTSGKIYPKGGVRQGDPLLSPIFNLLTHRLLNSLSYDIGVRFDQRKTNASAFVDDVNLYATTLTKVLHWASDPQEEAKDSCTYLGVQFTWAGRKKIKPLSGRLLKG